MRKPRKIKSRASIIDKSCSADETLVLRAHMHWIFFVKGMTWCVGFFLASYMMGQLSIVLVPFLNSIYRPDLAYLLFHSNGYIQAILKGAGIVMFLAYAVAYFTTAIGLTTKRLIVRKGLIFVELINIDVHEIKGEYVDHGILGRFLDYGEIHMDAQFIQNFFVPNISNPYRLLRALNEARAVKGDTVVPGEIELEPAPPEAVAPPRPQAYIPPTPAPPPPELAPPQPAAPAPTAVGPTVSMALPPAAVTTVTYGAPNATAAPVTRETVEPAAEKPAAPAVPPEEIKKADIDITPEPKTPHTVEELDSVAETFTHTAEPPAQVLEETDEYVVIKKKKA